MSTTTKSTKLTLRRESLRELTADALAGVGGGGVPSNGACAGMTSWARQI